MKKFTVHSYLFDIIQAIESLVYSRVAENCQNRWNHNPCVGGSSPSSATKIQPFLNVPYRAVYTSPVNFLV
jgi:hypothetical protein